MEWTESPEILCGRYKSGNSNPAHDGAQVHVRECHHVLCSVRNLYYYYFKTQRGKAETKYNAECVEKSINKMTESMQFVYYVSIHLFLYLHFVRGSATHAHCIRRTIFVAFAFSFAPPAYVRWLQLTLYSCTNMCKMFVCTIFRVRFGRQVKQTRCNGYSVHACLRYLASNEHNTCTIFVWYFFFLSFTCPQLCAFVVARDRSLKQRRKQ